MARRQVDWDDEFEEDEWHERDFHRRGVSHARHPPPPIRAPARRSGADLLSTDHFTSRLRSRSTGAQPAPNVKVYMSQYTNNDNHESDRSLSPEPPRRGASRGRRDDRQTTAIAERLEDIDYDLRRMSSRGRTPDFLRRELSPGVNRMELELHARQERADREREIERERLLRESDLSRERLSREAEKEKILRDIERERLFHDRDLEKERYARERLEDKLNMEMSAFKKKKELDDRYDQERLREADWRAAELEKERIREIEERDQALYKKKLELARLKDRIEREEEEAKLEKRDKEWKSRLEIEKLKEEQKRQKADLERKEEREKFLAEMDRQEKAAKADRQRIKLEIEAKEREDEEERKEILERAERQKRKEDEKQKEIVARAELKRKEQEAAEKKREADFLAAHQQKLADQKKKDDEARERFRLEDEAKKKKAKEEEDRIKAKIKEEAEKAKEKQKAEEKKLEEEMHKRLAKFGFQENQIEAVLDPKKAANLPPGASPANPQHAVAPYHRPHHDHFHHAATPTYIKVHRSHVDVETLKYFGLPWEYDTDTDYIVILQEMDTHETELLFEHTRKLRRGGAHLLIEERGRHGHKDYAFVRRRKPSASPARRKKSPVRVGLGSLF
ncbi:hypothetical protein FKW77_006722 [Venturia effusa]|uniref:Uncharacterized protein n=1 Tax=Venturia effusa TaxID=50376 RepID=A0A517LFQ9_9PEZI|nr:hypothetical protein FKW77_006722 [Venturia effusa]